MAASVTAVQRRAPIGKVNGAQSTRSAPVGKAGAHIKRGSVNGAVKSASGAAQAAANGVHLSPYEIMASRIANRVAEMAESITFVERPKTAPAHEPTVSEKKKPRKLEIRLQNSGPDSVSFSPAFLDNTLKKMLDLQSRMLRVSAELGAAEDVEEEVKKEQFAQTSELSRIIALICAEKARQGA
ncbi:hypothetical protein NA57DRAFT_77576 [Rhizodiscina lignyota]|uniref:Uncharacterized protein n=1 Tax=Rhizodiscina lignyota TaxID=1504668 RepID=A0A9P4IC70_9PEZI|nr:hypothetical protein NA57DRAFT_77576 [Rhizodiscina lignyota]